MRRHKLITSVQSRWRAITVRKLIIIFRYEVIRIREVRTAACFKLTRLWRGWIARRRIVQTRLASVLATRRAVDYAAARNSKREHSHHAAMNTRLGHMYVEERAEERAARFCGLVHPSSAGGRKMVAFQISSYGNDRAAVGSAQVIRSLNDKLVIAEETEGRLAKRGDWLKRQCLNSAPIQSYHAEEIRTRNTTLVKATTKSKPRTRLLAILQKHNVKRKFKYPGDIYRDPQAALHEGLLTGNDDAILGAISSTSQFTTPSSL